MTERYEQNYKPLVTVLMSTYNRPQYLREALASVFAQTWEHFQVVLVRDGGLPVRDAIAEFLDDPRMTFIDRSVNCGKAKSFNEALERVRGEYICYLDDDDLFYPHHIETLVNALLSQDRCQVAYSDLYKAHCRVLPDGRRRVLAKNVEVSRDFDRMLMLQFNHVLHVSVMHRRDLLDKTGSYNENINVLIDWDLTRRLCFYTDFLHVPIVTGEFFAPVGDCDRISVKRRKNVNQYIWNLLTIRSTRPAKPWPCMRDLSVIVLPDSPQADLPRLLTDLWSHTFFPSVYYVSLSPSERACWKSQVPNVKLIDVAEKASPQMRLDAALAACEGDFTAVVSTGQQMGSDDVAFLERSLWPLLNSDDPDIAYELPDSTPPHWSAVFHTDTLRDVRARFGALPTAASVEAAGVDVRKPRFEEYPFQFDNFLNTAAQMEREGDYSYAIKVYDHLAEGYGNALWMQTLKANALYQKGHWSAAAELAETLNDRCPTIARLLIEARARRKMNDYAAAVALYKRAEAILDGSSTGFIQGRFDAAAEPSGPPAQAASRQEETLIWTS